MPLEHCPQSLCPLPLQTSAHVMGRKLNCFLLNIGHRFNWHHCVCTNALVISWQSILKFNLSLALSNHFSPHSYASSLDRNTGSVCVNSPSNWLDCLHCLLVCKHSFLAYWSIYILYYTYKLFCFPILCLLIKYPRSSLLNQVRKSQCQCVNIV